nr:F0F1 ATP synthase subunit alpha [Candidatus Saccharimonas sp.]
WEQVASIFAVSEGLFDKVPASKIKDAQKAFLTRLWTDHKEAMRALNKGDKKLDDQADVEKALKEVGKSVAKGFEG